MSSEPTKILHISVGIVQRTPVPFRKIRGGRKDDFFSYLFMHDSVFDVELKYLEDMRALIIILNHPLD